MFTGTECAPMNSTLAHPQKLGTIGQHDRHLPPRPDPQLEQAVRRTLSVGEHPRPRDLLVAPLQPGRVGMIARPLTDELLDRLLGRRAMGALCQGFNGSPRGAAACLRRHRPPAPAGRRGQGCPRDGDRRHRRRHRRVAVVRVLAVASEPSALTLAGQHGRRHLAPRVARVPDLDTTLYAVGPSDAERGWGLRDESFRCMDELRGLGQEVWFNLGDRDLATHLLRTELLRDGASLSAVTSRLAAAMGVAVRVLLMTDAEVATTIETADGRWPHYEEYLVREGSGASMVRRVVYDGGVRAAGGGRARGDLPPPAASCSPRAACRMSIAWCQVVPGVREALTAASARVEVAVSPIVSASGSPTWRPRPRAGAALLRASGVEPSATGVAGLYRDICDRFVVDRADAGEADAIRGLGLDVVAVPTLGTSARRPRSCSTPCSPSPRRPHEPDRRARAAPHRAPLRRRRHPRRRAGGACSRPAWPCRTGATRTRGGAWSCAARARRTRAGRRSSTR
ncbi:MAG: 2-phospho-L-lactate transferase CofD family protein [Solirubrobacteraceae bacterium]